MAYSNEAMKLTNSGITLSKGGIRAGTVDTTNFIYLSTENFSETTSGHSSGQIGIDDYHKNDWNQIIGTNFAVDIDGRLYAKEVNVSGNINITSGNVYTKTESIEITKTLTDSIKDLIGDTVYSDGEHDVFYDEDTENYYYFNNEQEEINVQETSLNHVFVDSEQQEHLLYWDSNQANYYYEIEQTRYYLNPEDFENVKLVTYHSDGEIDKITDNIEEMSGTVSNHNQQFIDVNERVGDIEELVPEVKKMIGMITLNPDPPDGPEIIVSAGDNNVRITEDKVALRVGETEVAYIDQDKMYISQAEILNENDLTKSSLRIGPFMWSVKSENRICLVYAPRTNVNNGGN